MKYWEFASARARLAQSAERKALNLVVVGSSPTVGVGLADVCACLCCKRDDSVRGKHRGACADRGKVGKRGASGARPHVGRKASAGPERGKRGITGAAGQCARGVRGASARGQSLRAGVAPREVRAGARFAFDRLRAGSEPRVWSAPRVASAAAGPPPRVTTAARDHRRA